MSTKFSQFIIGGAAVAGDIIVGLRNGENTQFSYTPGGPTSIIVVQAAHGFVVGNMIRYNGTEYVRAQADTFNDSQSIGMVSSVIDVNTFIISTNGLVENLSGLVAGSPYYLDPINPGNLTLTPPSTQGQIVKEVFIANSTTSGFLLNYEGSYSTNLLLTGNQIISNNTNGNINIAPNGSGQMYAASSLNIQSGNALKWYNSSNSFYSAFQASSGLAASTTWNLPTADGMSSYVLTTDGSGNLSFEPSGSEGQVTIPVSQTAHGFTVGQVVLFNGSSYVLAQADNAVDAEVIGIVSVIDGVNAFTLLTEGFVNGLSGLTSGQVYFLSDATPGLLTTTEPVTIGHISKPLMISNSATSGYFHNWRGKVIASSPVSFIWNIVTSDTTMAANEGYFVNSTGPVNMTLPSTFILGDMIQVVNVNIGGWTIVQNSGQQIRYGNQITTAGAGGSLSSTQNGDAISMVCYVANTQLAVTPGSIGNITIV